MSKLILDRLKEKFGSDVLETSSFRGDDVAVVVPARWREVALFLRDDPRCLCDFFIDLSAIEMALANRAGREGILRQRIEADPACRADVGASPRHDVMVIDCPPSLGLLSLNAMAAVDEVLLPLQPHFLALHGLSKLLETIELVAEHVNPRLRLLGVVLCMYEAGTRLAAEVGRDVQSFFASAPTRHPAWGGAQVFETRVRRNIRLAEAPSFGQSIFDYAPDSHGAADYAALAAEVDQAAAVLRDPVRLAA